MKDFIVNGWMFWILATLCASVALGFNIGVGDGFAGAAIGFAFAAFFKAFDSVA